MSRIRNLVLPLFLLMATFSAGSTQAHQPLKTTIYQVEALRWYWISGYSWHSVYETTDHDDAEFVEALLHIALENDQTTRCSTTKARPPFMISASQR